MSDMFPRIERADFRLSAEFGRNLRVDPQKTLLFQCIIFIS